jgi:transposase
MKKVHVQLSEAERSELKRLLSKGHLRARQFKRATGLLELDRGKSLQDVSQTLGVAYMTVASWRDNYRERGLSALEDRPRSGRPIEIDGAQRAKVTALACSEAPTGHSRWDLRLLADKAVELGYCEHLSHTYVRKILKKTNSNRI